jgi:hypothetical protein
MTDMTFQAHRDPEYLSGISEYLNALANPTRLKILQALEGHPMELREITAIAETSYENVRKHLDKLVLAGVVRKDAGVSSETVTGIHPVWKYSLAPGGMEAIITNLSMFAKAPLFIRESEITEQLQQVRAKVTEQFGKAPPCMYLTGGPLVGTIFPLETDRVAIGREEPGGGPMPGQKIILPREYRSVSRVTRPHCLIFHSTRWEIEDCGSTSGTFINNSPINPRTRHEIRDGDIIILGSGAFLARFIFLDNSAA